jgi:hypothetical protein
MIGSVPPLVFREAHGRIPIDVTFAPFGTLATEIAYESLFPTVVVRL